MTNDELEAIRARDADYNDIFEQHAHRLVAWPVHDRRALLAEVDRLREVFASGASTMAQATDEIERLRRERDELRADAERYRWLRDRSTPPDAVYIATDRITQSMVGDSIDAAIDAAMSIDAAMAQEPPR